MKLPRNLSSNELTKKLNKIGFYETRQRGSHIRLTKSDDVKVYHITIPNHNPLKIGTLNSILNGVAENLEITKDELLKLLF